MAFPASPSLSPARQSPARVPAKWVWVLLLGVILGLKFFDLTRGVYNSDEPQHLFVAWSWTQGLVQYRDYFDNHTPLFHLLLAPVTRLIENRPDALLLARVAMLPFWALAAGAVAWIATRLYSRKAGFYAALLALACPPLMVVGSEFRADVLWTVLWLWTVAVAVSGPFTARRAGITGLLFGLTVLASIKTSLLAASLVAAVATGFLLLDRPARKTFCTGIFGKLLLLGLGFLIPAAAFAAFLEHHQAVQAFVACVFQHNTGVPILEKQHGRPWIGAVLLTATFGVLWLRRGVLRQGNAGEAPLQCRRLVVLLIPIFYHISHLLLAGVLPLGARQDYLPCLPLLAVPLAGWIAARPQPKAAPLLALAVLAEVVAMFVMKPASHRNSLAQLTRDIQALTLPGEPVMSPKGEALFRPRPCYSILETVTQRKIRSGLIADTIVQDLAATHTTVCILSEKIYPPASYAWIDRHFLPVSASVWVAGCRIPAADPGAERLVEPGIATDYTLLTREGAPCEATVDGIVRNGPFHLEAGPHRVVSPNPGPLDLVWARAVAKGYRPFAAAGVRPQPTP